MLPRKSPRISKLPKTNYYAKTEIQNKTSVATPKRKRAAPKKSLLEPEKKVAKHKPTAATTVTDKKHAYTAENTGKDLAPPAAAPSVADPIDVVDKVAVDRSFDVHEAFAHLKKVDKKLNKLITNDDIEEFIKRRVQQTDSSNPFRDLASSIIYQQISGKVAQAIRTRFVKLFAEEQKIKVPEVITGHFSWFPTAEMVLKKTPEELRTVGLSNRKAQYILDLSQKFKDNHIDADKLHKMTDDEIRELLIQVKGIGHWTVDMYLMMDLGHPDILPTTDLGIRKGVAKHFGLKNNLPLPDQMEKLTDHWRPYRSVGSWYMWRLLDIKTAAD
ncbi:DNA glycosylase [Phascolomyces articulosus]|uniref:DNA glycosylase n=1 Tax=Phascolomyces articulosus TaxID=60185 RepID=A0AAD5PCT3_9FUNG|nr:DNA glycosylase [Phascolomyces articulosus]